MSPKVTDEKNDGTLRLRKIMDCSPAKILSLDKRSNLEPTRTIKLIVEDRYTRKVMMLNSTSPESHCSKSVRNSSAGGVMELMASTTTAGREKIESPSPIRATAIIIAADPMIMMKKLTFAKKRRVYSISSSRLFRDATAPAARVSLMSKMIF